MVSFSLDLVLIEAMQLSKVFCWREAGKFKEVADQVALVKISALQ
jgi:hypothetical protein